MTLQISKQQEQKKQMIAYYFPLFYPLSHHLKQQTHQNSYHPFYQLHFYKIPPHFHKMHPQFQPHFHKICPQFQPLVLQGLRSLVHLEE